ncbi:HVO_2922 family protein [Natrialbaceae archaeon A-arb3/5]
MANPDQADENAAEAKDDEEEYEYEQLVSRAEGEAVLRRLADRVASGAIQLGDAEGPTVRIPAGFELEIEYEADEEAAELEVELEWPLVDGEAVAPDGVSAARADDADEASEGEAVVETGADIAGLVEPAAETSSAEFELYRDRADEWRWRLVHDNGNIIADSGEGYDRKAGARNGLESVMRNAPAADVVVREE